MATYTNFCCRSGGSNLNAGTRTGDTTVPGTAANLTYASGNWVSATGVFTVASGDPVADGVVAGDFASVYADGATETTLIGRVTARTTTTITVSTTAKTGTTTDGTGNRTLKIGGAWAGPNGAIPFLDTFPGQNATNAAANHPRVNLKNDAAYSITAVIPFASLDVQHVWGFTTAYGDGGRAVIDGGTTGASYSLVSVAATVVTMRFVDMEFRNNGATGSTAAVAITGNGAMFHRCVVHDVRGRGFSTTVNTSFIECEAYACNQSNTAAIGAFHSTGEGSHYVRCIAHDNTGSEVVGFLSASSAMFNSCIADSNGNDGFRSTSASQSVTYNQCDAYNNGVDGIQLGGSVSATVHSCNLVKNGGYGIAGSTTHADIRNCGFGSGTQANTSGEIESTLQAEESGRVTYAANVTPWVDPATGDFRITLATAKGTGRGTFLQTAASYTGTIGYPDIGSAQHLEGASGAPASRIQTGM